MSLTMNNIKHFQLVYHTNKLTANIKDNKNGLNLLLVKECLRKWCCN